MPQLANRFTVGALFILLFVAGVASAQTTLGYRQIDLNCIPGCSAPNHSDSLNNPWGIAVLTGQNFFVAENGAGSVDSFDSAGVLASSVSIPLPAGSTVGASKPTGIVADPEMNFLAHNVRYSLFAATEEGTIVGFTLNNGVPDQGTVLVDRSSSAVFTGITILHPSCCNPVLAVANFHDAEIDIFGLSSIALPGAFQDPNLPAGYAPFNIQTVGSFVFVTYAKQDDAKRAPVFGNGNGIVSIFDQDGNFVLRFISNGGALNAPWGITPSSANFGPFPKTILIGNTGDGSIGVYDSGSGQLLSVLTNGEGDRFVNPGMHAMVFRSDGIGDPDSLYFTANSDVRGLFSSIGVGRLTSTALSTENTVVGQSSPIVAQVHPLSGGDTATGTVVLIDSGVKIGETQLVNGVANFLQSFNTAGLHLLSAEYQGTDNLLPSIDRKQITVLGPPTTTTLTAPANAGPGTSVTFTAKTQSAGATPVGMVVFKEGNTVLGSVPLDGNGTATFTTTTLSTGVHSVVAEFLGSTSFQTSSSSAVTVTVGGDFTFIPNLPSLSITVGQSADLNITVTPTSAFAGTVRFSCSGPAAISCSFTPSTLDVGAAAATTKLTITANSALARTSPPTAEFAFASVGLFGSVFLGGLSKRTRRAALMTAIAALGLATVACGGYSSQKTSTPPKTAMVTVTATAGSVTHTTNISVTVQ